MARDLPPALRALFDTGVALARRSTSARVAIARAAGLVDVSGLPADVRAPVQAELDEAVRLTCVPMDPKDAERALRDAWGSAPATVLDDLDLDEPLAVRPASVVFKGSVDGGDVAIKVQRPGLAAATRNDLVLLDALAVPLRAVFGGIDAGEILREIRAGAMDELDYEHEASTQRLVGRLLRPVDGIRVPRPNLDLSHPTVLVSELVAGQTLLDAAPADPAATARTLIEAHVVAARDGGMALTDPRPGHVVLERDGVALLGAGLARPVDKARVAAALSGAPLLRAGDDAAFAELLSGELALLPAELAARVPDLARSAGGPLLAGRARLDHPALGDAAERGLRDVRAWFEVAGAGTPRADDIWPARGVGQLVAVLATLGAEEDWLGLLGS